MLFADACARICHKVLWSLQDELYGLDMLEVNKDGKIQRLVRLHTWFCRKHLSCYNTGRPYMPACIATHPGALLQVSFRQLTLNEERELVKEPYQRPTAKA